MAASAHLGIMSDAIQFQCPACARPLRLPAATAGVQGPCPSCAQEIISPDPQQQLPARLAPAPAPSPPAAPSKAAASRRTVSLSTLILSCLLAALLGFIAGILAHSPAPRSPGPRTALLDFLNAPDSAARTALSLAADPADPADLPGGPIAFTEATPGQTDPNLHVFIVRTPHIPDGFPVAVHRTRDGWRVDARTFAEFHDDHFHAFLADAAGSRGHFHLLVKPGPPEEPDAHFVRFDLSPPMPGREHPAWVRKDSPSHTRLREIFADMHGSDSAGTPLVLALSKYETPARNTFLEIEEVVAPDWNPRPR